jgi:CDP-diacylglycerol---glycerol-3-phosphate 3-phosphatidyltransferase
MSQVKDLSATLASAPRRFWNVPNSLTVGRIDFQLYIAAMAVFIVAAVTDALDGYFARLLQQATPLGRQLDPLIDKVIVSGCYIYLATIPGSGVLPWMVTAIVVRELLIQGLRSHLEGQGQAFGARTAGKLKTVVQCISISVVLFCLSLESPHFGLLALRDGATWLAVLLTVYSGISYVWIAMPKLRGEP